MCVEGGEMLNINAFSAINSNTQVQFKGSSTKANSKEAATIIKHRR